MSTSNLHPIFAEILAPYAPKPLMEKMMTTDIRTSTIDIDELGVTIIYAEGGKAESLSAIDFQVDVEFTHRKDVDLTLIDIRSIKLTRATPFNTFGVNMWLSRGYDVTGFFTRHQIEAMEEKLLTKTEK